MTEFTKDIKTLTQQASSSPQLQANTGSLAGDVIGAVGFGLDLYRRNKAETELGEAKQQATDYNTAVAEGSVGYRNLLLKFKDQQLTKGQIRRQEAKWFSQQGYGADMQAAVINGGNSLAKETVGGLMRESIALELERKATDEKLTADSIEGAALTGQSTLGIENLSTQERVSFKLEGMKVKAERQAESAKIALAIQNGQYNDWKDSKKTKTYLNSSLPAASIDISSKLNTLVDSNGGFASMDKEALFSGVNAIRQEIPNLLKKHMEGAADAGVELTADQQRGFTEGMESILTSYEGMMKETAVVTALENLPTKIMYEQINKSLLSGDPAVRDASRVVLMHMKGNTFSGVDMAAQVNMIADFSTGRTAFGGDDDDELVKSVEMAFGTPAGENGMFLESQWKINNDILINTFDNTRPRIDAAIAAGALPKTIAAVAKTDAKGISPEDQAEALRIYSREASRTLSSAISAALNTKKMALVGGGGLKGREYKDTRTAPQYTLNPETMQLEPLEGGVYLTEGVKQFNSYMKDTQKVIGDLGGDVEAWNKDAIKSVLSAKIKD